MLLVMNLHFIRTVLKSKYSGSCNNINDPPAKIYFPNSIKNINLKVFNLIFRESGTR